MRLWRTIFFYLSPQKWSDVLFSELSHSLICICLLWHFWRKICMVQWVPGHRIAKSFKIWICLGISKGKSKRLFLGWQVYEFRAQQQQKKIMKHSRHSLQLLLLTPIFAHRSSIPYLKKEKHTQLFVHILEPGPKIWKKWTVLPIHLIFFNVFRSNIYKYIALLLSSRDSSKSAGLSAT